MCQFQFYYLCTANSRIQFSVRNYSNAGIKRLQYSVKAFFTVQRTERNTHKYLIVPVCERELVMALWWSERCSLAFRFVMMAPPPP